MNKTFLWFRFRHYNHNFYYANCIGKWYIRLLWIELAFIKCDWRYYWRFYLGFIPIQFCVTCGRWYWGGFPRWIKDETKWNSYFPYSLQWLPWWMDFCSWDCYDNDIFY